MPKTRGKTKQETKEVEKNQKKQSKPKKKVQKEEKSKEKQVKQKPQKQASQDEAEPEIKPVVKAKKYKKKTYDQLLRINKSKYQRIFLLSAKRNQQNWEFHVQGTTGSQYHVSVSTVVHCTCMDFRFKKIPCKHIYFIVTQVGQNDELLDYFKNDRKISKNAYKILDKQLTERLKSRMEKSTNAKDAKDIDLKDDTDCVICFSEMIKETEPLQDCSTCKKYFHVVCIVAWKAHNSTCPLCRGALAGGIGSGTDPLGKLTGIQL